MSKHMLHLRVVEKEYSIPVDCAHTIEDDIAVHQCAIFRRSFVRRRRAPDRRADDSESIESYRYNISTSWLVASRAIELHRMVCAIC